VKTSESVVIGGKKNKENHCPQKSIARGPGWYTSGGVKDVIKPGKSLPGLWRERDVCNTLNGRRPGQNEESKEDEGLVVEDLG